MERTSAGARLARCEKISRVRAQRVFGSVRRLVIWSCAYRCSSSCYTRVPLGFHDRVLLHLYTA